MVYSYKVWWFLAGAGATLNLFDAVATLLENRVGVPEGNPIMALGLALGVPAFLLIKAGVGALFVFLAQYRHRRYAKAGLAAAFGAYFGIALYHLYGMFNFLS